MEAMFRSDRSTACQRWQEKQAPENIHYKTREEPSIGQSSHPPTGPRPHLPGGTVYRCPWLLIGCGLDTVFVQCKKCLTPRRDLLVGCTGEAVSVIRSEVPDWSLEEPDCCRARLTLLFYLEIWHQSHLIGKRILFQHLKNIYILRFEIFPVQPQKPFIAPYVTHTGNGHGGLCNKRRQI